MRQQRLKPEARKEDILAVALALAVVTGYTKLTRERVGEAAGVSGATLSYHFGTMAQFRRALLRYAARVRCLPVIAQGVVSGESSLREGGPLRKQALASLR
ncbi:TetR/AcrR family transcriptional regulator [bacterium]|nr:TetR/AcrR family transcriptional regulator [bacterium]